GITLSAERERERLHARIEKLDRDLSIGDGLRLSDQLIQPLFRNRAVALVVNVKSVSRARRLPIDQHAKSHGRSPHRGGSGKARRGRDQPCDAPGSRRWAEGGRAGLQLAGVVWPFGAPGPALQGLTGCTDRRPGPTSL